MKTFSYIFAIGLLTVSSIVSAAGPEGAWVTGVQSNTSRADITKDGDLYKGRIGSSTFAGRYKNGELTTGLLGCPTLFYESKTDTLVVCGKTLSREEKELLSVFENLPAVMCRGILDEIGFRKANLDQAIAAVKKTNEGLTAYIEVIKESSDTVTIMSTYPALNKAAIRFKITNMGPMSGSPGSFEIKAKCSTQNTKLRACGEICR
jgi:hypothetical protein